MSSPMMTVRAFTGIDTLELWDGEYVRDVDEALEWAAANREELNGRWLEYSEQE